MTPIVAFPTLALAMRSAPTYQAFDLVVYLARSVDVAVQLKKSHAPQSAIDNYKEDLMRRQCEEYPRRNTTTALHVCARVNMNEMFDFIFAHADTDVRRGPVGRVANTPAAEWLVRCALCAGDDFDEEFYWTWTSYLTKQPKYTARSFSEARYYDEQVDAFDEHATTGVFLGLQRAVHKLPHDTDGQHLVLHEYWRLGATAAALWEHMWEEHDIQRGQPLPVYDLHLNSALQEIRKVMRYNVRDWMSTTPLRVRRILAQCDFESDLMFLVNHVFPLAIAPPASTINEGSFGWEIWEWINHAATKAGTTVPELTQPLDPALGGTGRSFFRPRGVEEYITYGSSVESVEIMDDVELEPFGPSNNVLDYASVVQNTSLDESCTICLDNLSSKDASTCAVEVEVCGHVFHRDCLDLWINGSHSAAGVSCPNCRTKICDARPRRVQRES